MNWNDMMENIKKQAEEIEERRKKPEYNKDNEVFGVKEALECEDGFKVSCKKCGSKDVTLFGLGPERKDITPETGLKCVACGNAKYWFELK